MIPDLQSRLRQWHRLGRWRLRRCQSTEQPSGRVRIASDQQSYLSFISNDYLGLAAHPQVRSAVAQAAGLHGHGSGGSALIGGYHPLARTIEEESAAWLGRDAAVLVGSGFAANLAVGQAVLGQRLRRDAVEASAHFVIDHNAHASILDAARLSGWPIVRFRHNNTAHLRHKLDSLASTEIAVITEGLFSMDGDSPDWSELCAATSERAALIVDEAHSFGVLGASGRGACAHLSQQQVRLVVIPLGKAIGGYGALICGQQSYIDAIIEFARSYIYSTALPPAVIAGNLCALRLIPQSGDARQSLQDNISYLHKCLNQMDLSYQGSHTSPIVLIPCQSNQSLIEAATRLQENSILIGAIRAPTVQHPKLRISVRAGHSRADLDQLVHHLHLSLRIGSQP